MEQTSPAVLGPVEPPVMQRPGGEPASAPQTFKIEVVFGSVELQQRPVFDGRRMGYESRCVTKDRDGAVTKIGDWKPPPCWLIFPEPEPARRPWWTRLLGDA